MQTGLRARELQTLFNKHCSELATCGERFPMTSCADPGVFALGRLDLRLPLLGMHSQVFEASLILLLLDCKRPAPWRFCRTFHC